MFGKILLIQGDDFGITVHDDLDAIGVLHMVHILESDDAADLGGETFDGVARI